MIQQRLLEEMEWVAGRYRRLYRWSAMSVVWLAAALVGASLLTIGWRTGWTSTWTAPTLALVALALSCFVFWRGGRSTRDSHWVASRIETRHPELASLLLAAIEQRPDLPDGRFGFLQETVIRGALAHNRDTRWEEDVPPERILVVQVAGLAALATLIVVTVALAGHAELSRSVAGLSPGLDASARAVPYALTVTPGDTEIERGTSLVVTARFAGNVPDNATLVHWDRAGETARVPMSLSLSDPVFGARVAGVQTDLSYKVEYAEHSSRDYRVSVFEYPALQRADAELVFPEYTSLEKKRIEDTRRITSVEGTELTLFCDLNKPVRTARLVDKEGKSIELTARGDDPTVYSATQVLDASMRCRLELVDAEGRRNQQPPEFVFNVTPNRRPDVKIAQPGRDVRVSPIEELDTKASLWDDFGLLAYGVSYTLPGNPPQETALGEPTPGNQRKTVEHRIAFEDLEAEPDQLVAYYFWAEDAGPDGKPRRTMGDMYFAEVRHFEEIFRQGEQPPGGQSQQQQQQQQGGQNARQAEQLAEQQKQIINATWTVIRRETGAEPTEQFAGDVDELKTAQTQALEKLRELAEQLEDAQSREFAAAVEQHMTEAITHLTEAAQPSPAALQPALSAEQAAYQALLKLRAREHRVIRGRQPSQQGQSGSASGPQSRAQRQLDQLELTDSENLYETQRQASPPQEQSQRENLQVLNRLRELARRQADLNKRLTELQSALEEARTEEEREEIRRQLKRLREQQQQMVRDVDELAERMERPENQERMSQSRQDLEQTRQNIRQTTEALRQGQVSRAVASGTRAERQLEQMREEFRKAAANRFSDEARQLREDARQLHQNETDLAERLRALDRERPETKTLRDSDDREQLREEFREQREDLDTLLENIRRTVEEAEEAEPLMAGQLYDSFREARQQHVDDALDVTGELLNRGFVDQARLAESQAARGIEQLKRGVETAAENVLGDEDEALRRAHETLGELAAQLNEEMRRATGQSTETRDEQARDARGQADRLPTDGEQPQDGQPQDQQDGQQPPDARAADPSGRTGRRGSDRQPGEEPADSQQTRQAQQPERSQDEPDDQRGRGAGEPRTRDSEQGGRRDGAPSQQQLDGERAQTPTGLERFRRPDGPITGDFLRWSDQLRDVEEMIDDPDMRSEVARVRDAARGIRYQMRRDFTGPNWDLVRQFVAEPLNELRDRLAEELLRRQPDETLVPIDRDPVPPEYADQVRRYYEQLGRGQ